MLLASAASTYTHAPTSAPQAAPVVLDLAGRRIELTRAEATRLRAAAAAEAGTSSVARDLSVLLDRVLVRGHVLALRRGEAHTLAAVASRLGLDELAGRLAGSGG